MGSGARTWNNQGGTVRATQHLRRLVELLCVAIVYVALARIGQALAIPPGNVTPVWLPSGVMLAWALARGGGIWPGVLLGAFLGNIWAYIDLGDNGSLAPALFAGAANALGEVLAIIGSARLIATANGGSYPFLRAGHVLRFILFGAVLAPLISASFGVGSLLLAGLVPEPAGVVTFVTWATGFAMGVLILAPVILAFLHPYSLPPKRVRSLEIVLFIPALLGAVGLVVVLHPLRDAHHSAVVMAVPVMLWAVFRLGQRGAFATMVVVAAGGVLATLLLGAGLPGVLLNRELIDLQLAVGLLISTCLVVSAVLAEKGMVQGELQATRDGLDHAENKRRFLLREVDEHREAERRLNRALEYQRVYTEIQRLALDGLSMEETLQRILDVVVTVPFFVLGGRGAIFLADPETETLSLVGHRNIGQGVLSACGTLPFGKCLCGRAAARRELLHHAEVDGEHELTFPGMKPHGHYLVPILTGQEVRGVFNVYLEAGHQRDGEEEDFLRTVAGMVAGIIDRKRAEAELWESQAELARSNAELEQFAYAISHDLQEPLRMVSSYVTLIDKRYAEKLDEPGQEFLGFASEGASRMQAMIADLLSYSRVHSRGVDLEPVDSGDALEAALAALRASIRDQEGWIDASQALPRVMGDPGQLARLFQNLLGNALKYHVAEQPPEIKVWAEPWGEEGEWCFSIADNGIGIAESERERVFGVFRRLHGRGDYEGTGIGLALCKRIVERHGGNIWVDARPGGGSIFRFTLKAAE